MKHVDTCSFLRWLARFDLICVRASCVQFVLYFWPLQQSNFPPEVLGFPLTVVPILGPRPCAIISRISFSSASYRSSKSRVNGVCFEVKSNG